ncbi:recombinase zinc beta ribbon domain-containing protein [Chloroflexota bacterium]
MEYDSKKLEIREAEAQIVRHIYNVYVFDRLGVERIARKLNEDKVKPRQQARQWFAGVRDVDSHSGYKGEHPLKIEIPTIIESALWELAQQRRKDNHKLHQRKGSPWLLQGMIKCGLCGHGLGCGWGHKVRRIHSCRGRLQGTNPNSEHKCSLKSIDAEWLENAVWEKVTNALSNPPVKTYSLFHGIDFNRYQEPDTMVDQEDGRASIQIKTV